MVITNPVNFYHPMRLNFFGEKMNFIKGFQNAILSFFSTKCNLIFDIMVGNLFALDISILHLDLNRQFFCRRESSSKYSNLSMGIDMNLIQIKKLTR